MQFLTLKGAVFCFFFFYGEFFLFFTLQEWILCNSCPWRWIFSIFIFKGWILCSFHPSRVKSLQFLLSWDIFRVKSTKKLLLQWWILCTFGFYLSDWGFSLWNSACVLFCHKSPVFFWVICWHFLPFKRVFFTIFAFLGFFGMKMDKNFSCNGECLKILIFV